MTNTAADEAIGAGRWTQTAARPEPEHPMPWDCREERGYVVCDARGDIVVRVANASRVAQENLARAIASIPDREAEILRLRIRNAELQSTIVNLDAELRAALKAGRAAPRETGPAPGQQSAAAGGQTLAPTHRAVELPETRADGEALVAAGVSPLELLHTLAGPWGRLPDARATIAGDRSDGGAATYAHPAQPTP